jgi:hypothetical protein
MVKQPNIIARLKDSFVIFTDKLVVSIRIFSFLNAFIYRFKKKNQGQSL